MTKEKRCPECLEMVKGCGCTKPYERVKELFTKLGIPFDLERIGEDVYITLTGDIESVDLIWKKEEWSGIL